MFIPREPLTKENIFKKITSYDIFKYYCSGFSKVGEMFKSELREDTNPSCCISNISGDLLYTDFGQGSYRCIDYVMAKYNISYIEALHRINSDFSLGLSTTIPYNVAGGVYTPPTTYGKVQFKEKKPTIIRIKSREFTKQDLDYWYQYLWTKEMLEKANIKSLSHYWIDNDKNANQIYYVDKDEVCFSYEYYWSNDIFRRKIYLPNSRIRFISNIDSSIVQGYHLLPKEGGDILFITSSLKDCGIFWLLGYNAIAPNNEETLFPESYVEKLKMRWKRIIIFFDNDFTKKDNTGVNNAIKFHQKYGFEYYYTPDGTEKDPSDYVKSYGLQAFKELLESKIYSTNIESKLNNNEIPF